MPRHRRSQRDISTPLHAFAHSMSRHWHWAGPLAPTTLMACFPAQGSCSCGTRAIADPRSPHAHTHRVGLELVHSKELHPTPALAHTHTRHTHTHARARERERGSRALAWDMRHMGWTHGTDPSTSTDLPPPTTNTTHTRISKRPRQWRCKELSPVAYVGAGPTPARV